MFATGPVQLDEDGAHLRRELGRLLSEGLGSNVEIVAEKTYAKLLERVVEGGAHVAWLPPATFVRAEQRGAIARVLTTERLSGPRYQSALFVRTDSGIESIDALRGKRVAWVDRDSCAGYLFPRLELLDRGHDPRSFFSTSTFLDSHSRVVRAVQQGDFEVGATYVQLRDPQNAEGGLALVGWAPFVAPSAMRAVLVSRSIPADAVGITTAVPEAERDGLVAALAAIHDRPKVARVLRGLLDADRLIRGEPAVYAPVANAMASDPQ